jgi:hypothetical protein
VPVEILIAPVGHLHSITPRSRRTYLVAHRNETIDRNDLVLDMPSMKSLPQRGRVFDNGRI